MSSVSRPIKGHGTPCTEVTGCPRPASFRIMIKGVHSGKASPAYPCKLHTTTVLTRMTAISNDIHVRGMANVRTVDTM